MSTQEAVTLGLLKGSAVITTATVELLFPNSVFQLLCLRWLLILQSVTMQCPLFLVPHLYFLENWDHSGNSQPD